MSKANVVFWKAAARHLKEEIYALYPVRRDPRTSPCAKVFVALLGGYVFSPIDSVPDFILVVGPLDEMVVVAVWLLLATLGAFLTLRMAQGFGT